MMTQLSTRQDLAACTRRWQARLDAFRRQAPPPWWAPGLILTPEIRGVYERHLPVADFLRDLARLAARRLPSPAWLPLPLRGIRGSCSHAGCGEASAPWPSLPDLWRTLPAELAGRVTFTEAELPALWRALANPARFGTDFGRYPEQLRQLREWVASYGLRVAGLGEEGLWSVARGLWGKRTTETGDKKTGRRTTGSDTKGNKRLLCASEPSVKPLTGGGLRLLDLGCGTGEGTAEAAAVLAEGAGRSVLALGVTGEPLEVAEAHEQLPALNAAAGPAARLNFVAGDALAAPCRGGVWHVILVNGLAGGMLADDAEFMLLLKELHRLLAPGGAAFLAQRFHAGRRPRVERFANLAKTAGWTVAGTPECLVLLA